MMILITYDIGTTSEGGVKRLQKVAKKCESYGQRVQNSVFECVLDYSQFTILKHELVQLIDIDNDSLRFYHLGKNYKNKVEHIGVKEALDVEDFLIF
ncbi:CRISPR-associated endonuclease Cas2 [Fundicoccus culcitae]|uniref:CRISPR-associated endoribonuclease Cas2 n=1 Tax=Fundicoccus culcitae TaxID=2969821 RepID=A0ABY5P236_9LACT|nr:CRISPR-associated endonuclease Cas2 [Fundicoccus culcitae]UUX32768.1 CRISPR-associated endonuclease Cas2 [Fundicoccus culcitae]